jgi:ectoine hydroxylase-related dioxygenase (phytanoyl-CoA dioxygenase family)
MGYMKLSQEELSNGKLAPETLEEAATQVKLNGFVVIENALPIDLVEELKVDFLQTVDEVLRTNVEKTEVNTRAFRKNRIRMDLPFRDPYINPQIITNTYALPIIDKILGEDNRVFYFSADAPMAGSDYQDVHGDYVPFFPESDAVLPISGLVVNFPLVDVTEQNGPMEAWPNTHLTPEKYYSGDYVKRSAAQLDPVKMLTPKGSMIIRDVRMWHRGTPNLSGEIRPNLALIYARHWWDGYFYPQESIGISKVAHEGLSERAKKLFRFEKIED